MDVAAIPVAVSFTDFIRRAIEGSKVLIALIGPQWLTEIDKPDDYVRMEIEVAIANDITVLPVLIGNTPMPDAAELPESISRIAFQNAVTVSVLHDFHTHMQSLLPKIESILGALAAQSVATSDPDMIERACYGIVEYLRSYCPEREDASGGVVQWQVVGTDHFGLFDPHSAPMVTFFLHRIRRLEELVELHFILSFWTADARSEHLLAGWVVSQLEQTPIVPDEFFVPDGMTTECDLKLRRSDEDARQVWRMITNGPLRLSLTYVATVSPKRPENE